MVLSGEVCVIAAEDDVDSGMGEAEESVGVGVGAEEQAAIPRVKAVINIITRQ
ncbi:MAG: hypothetical protein L7F78_19925 [Syntrophales bacterium LBB04]|nr:hypothetical protein [Syntrophales bacterium LBB04]